MVVRWEDRADHADGASLRAVGGDENRNLADAGHGENIVRPDAYLFSGRQISDADAEQAVDRTGYG